MGEVTEFRLSESQTAFWHSTARYQDLEGAVRSGKTTIALLKLLRRCQEYPGICCLATRWTEDNTKAQIKARLKELWPPDFLGRWNADEHCFECSNGSRVYVRGLKPGEDAGRYSKFAGLTLAIIYVDQPEEIPEDFFNALKARLSQPNMPAEMYLTPNPPDEDHWLASAFPDDNRDPEYHYIRTTVYDNADHLEPDYIPKLEAAYPPGHVLRLRFIEGKRGLSIVGQPVYAGYFSRALHESDQITYNPDLPLIEAWDFGHHHPAVLWSQFVFGRWLVLAELMGKDQFLEDFAPEALSIRQQLFPDVTEVLSCCDPAGGHKNSQGTATNAIDILREHGIFPTWKEGSNHPVLRLSAIQKISQALSRQRQGVPAVQIHPRCKEYLRGLEAGYVWDENTASAHSVYPNTRRPRKDGRYDHLQNCAEYAWVNFGAMDITPRKVQARKERDYWRQLAMAQRDIDEYDVNRRSRGRLAGYSRRGIL